MGNEKVIDVFDKLWKFIENKINASNKIIDYNKLRFSSEVYLPTDSLIHFRALTIFISSVIEKDGKYYPEIYLDECFYENNI